jgi:hypothetical protein
VQRDWTWDGLDGEGITVTRIVHIVGAPNIVETVGAFRLPRVIGSKSIAGAPPDPRAPIRQSTDLIFFDAFDPKPKPAIKLPGRPTSRETFRPRSPWSRFCSLLSKGFRQRIR